MSLPVIPLKQVAYFLEILAFAAIPIIYRSLSNYFDRCKEGESPVDKIVRKRIANNVSDSLEGRIAAILLLLKQGKEDEVFAEVMEGCKTASRNFYRGELYAGHVWHAIWAGALGDGSGRPSLPRVSDLRRRSAREGVSVTRCVDLGD